MKEALLYLFQEQPIKKSNGLACPRTELAGRHLLQTYFPKATTAFTAVTDQNQPAGCHYSQIVYNPQLRSFITDFVGQ